METSKSIACQDIWLEACHQVLLVVEFYIVTTVATFHQTGQFIHVVTPIAATLEWKVYDQIRVIHGMIFLLKDGFIYLHPC